MLHSCHGIFLIFLFRLCHTELLNVEELDSLICNDCFKVWSRYLRQLDRRLLLWSLLGDTGQARWPMSGEALILSHYCSSGHHLAASWPPPGHLWPVSSPHGNCSSGLHIHAQLTSNLAKLHVVFLDTLLAFLPKRCNSYSLICQGYLYEGRKILILESDYLFPCFIKLLIDSIHPFTLGVDCVSK